MVSIIQVVMWRFIVRILKAEEKGDSSAKCVSRRRTVETTAPRILTLPRVVVRTPLRKTGEFSSSKVMRSGQQVHHPPCISSVMRKPLEH